MLATDRKKSNRMGNNLQVKMSAALSNFNMTQNAVIAFM
jgi:hypothetical protein